MEIPKDISNHLFYTGWVLLVLQMGKILGSTFIYGLFSIIIDIAFDCALLLFGIGLIRIGLENSQITHWKISSIFIFSAAFFDIIMKILSFIFIDENWRLKSIIIIRLILTLLHLVALVFGFAYMKLFTDSLENLNIINRRGRFLISVGYIIQFYPYLAAWSVDWIYPKALHASIENTALVVFLIAAFVLIIGYLELVFTMKILRDGFVQEDFEEKIYEPKQDIIEEKEIGDQNNE